jgi:transcriptional regulator with XRE-family HTH domain
MEAVVRDLSREYRATLGALLREARKAKGVSQTRLADAIQAGDGSIVSHWESGRRHPSVTQLYHIHKQLALTDSIFEDLFYALQRETTQIPAYCLVTGKTTDQLLEDLERVNKLVEQFRAAGQPRAAVQIAGRDAELVLKRLRELPWSNAHLEVIRQVSLLVLQEVKAALDFLPRREVRNGGLNPQLEFLKGAGRICGDTDTRFVAALALEGATYVSGDVKNSFRQTRELLEQSERVPQIWMPELLRASAINAGKSHIPDALQDIQLRVDSMLEQAGDELSPDELGYLLEGLARGWAEFDPGRASALAQQAWTASGFDQSQHAGSSLRLVQLTRTKAEIELSRPSVASRAAIKEQVTVALAVSRREVLDRYTDQLLVLQARLA